MVSALVPGSKRSGFEPWGLLLEGAKKFSHPVSRGIISKLMITELFYLHILSITRSSLHTRFSGEHCSVFRYRFTKNGLTGPKSCPWPRDTELCFWARHFTLTLPLFTQGNELASQDGLASHPGGVEILLSRFMLQKPG